MKLTCKTLTTWTGALVFSMLTPLAQAAFTPITDPGFELGATVGSISASAWSPSAGVTRSDITGRSLAATFVNGGSIGQELIDIVDGATYLVTFFGALTYLGPGASALLTSSLTNVSPFPASVTVFPPPFSSMSGTFLGDSSGFFDLTFAFSTTSEDVDTRFYMDDLSYSCTANCDGSNGGGDPTRVPEPGTLALLGLALAGSAFARRRKP